MNRLFLTSLFALCLGGCASAERAWRPFIGLVFLEEPDEGDAPARGPLIRYVAQGSPAELSGLRTGDRVVEFDGRAPASPQEISQSVTGKPLQCLALRYLRDGQEASIACIKPSMTELGPRELHLEAERSVPVLETHGPGLRTGAFLLQKKTLKQALSEAGGKAGLTYYAAPLHSSQAGKCHGFDELDRLDPSGSWSLAECRTPKRIPRGAQERGRWFPDVPLKLLRVELVLFDQNRLSRASLSDGRAEQMVVPGDLVGEEEAEVLEGILDKRCIEILEGGTRRSLCQ